eukprot:6430496-Pyramimonas_sp.AAC.1
MGPRTLCGVRPNQIRRRRHVDRATWPSVELPYGATNCVRGAPIHIHVEGRRRRREEGEEE